MDTRIYFKQARALAAAGHEVVLVARAGGDICDLRYVPLPVPESRRGRFRTCVRVFFEALRLRCDAYHIHDPELLPVGVLLRVDVRVGVTVTPVGVRVGVLLRVGVRLGVTVTPPPGSLPHARLPLR